MTIIPNRQAYTITAPSIFFSVIEGYYSQSSGPLVKGLWEFETSIFLFIQGHLSYGLNQLTSILQLLKVDIPICHKMAISAQRFLTAFFVQKIYQIILNLMISKLAQSIGFMILHLGILRLANGLYQRNCFQNKQ